MTTIGRSKRMFINDSHNKITFPGVGAYNVQLMEARQTRGNSFTRAQRQITSPSATGYSSTRRRSYSNFRQPGPGSYSLELRRGFKITSFTHSKRFITDTSRLPGPGSYNSQDSQKQKIKAGIIPKSARVTTVIEKLPGPTDYQIPALIKYKNREPVIMIGRVKRSNFVNQNSPGPGAYNLAKDDLRESNRHFKINFNRNQMTSDRIRHNRKLQKQLKNIVQ